MHVSKKYATCEFICVLCYNTIKQMDGAIYNKRVRMLTFCVKLLHNNARPLELLPLQHWELFDHPSYSPDLTLCDYHLFTYLKNWLESKDFNNNELMKGVKTWLSSQVAETSLTQAYKNIFLNTSTSILVMTMLLKNVCIFCKQ
jgi:hypothetical protein